ncbi:hypothetical protein ABZY93_10630 [Streptomyces smyrnaeus]|uniref:esterase/lipase family protein n=1 Tax=Streptomyces smyrnaeus TaxID=1387713 RepID=UPI0033A1697C
MVRRARGALGALVAALLASLLLIPASPAHAKGQEENGAARAVVFVHGLDPWGNNEADCGQWDQAKKELRENWGYKGEMVTWGYYKGSRNCDDFYPGTVDTDLRTIGKELAAYIEKNWGSKGLAVDIVAHSMGGIVAREAIIRSNSEEVDMSVEDVVTMGTPNQGSRSAGLCFSKQCEQIRPTDGGADRNWYLWTLNLLSRKNLRLHETPGGTDWSTIGSGDDDVVSLDSATEGIYVQNKYRYYGNAGIEHSDYYTELDPPLPMQRSNDYGDSWDYWETISPLQTMGHALTVDGV